MAPLGVAGTVFKITPSGTLTTLYNFCSQISSIGTCTDGDYPEAGLVQAINGDLYGTTAGGGASSQGTVFKITPSGTLTTLYSFCSQSACADGTGPAGTLVQAVNGDFYGTTSLGGANGGGTVFTITPSGVLTTLYSFCAQSGCADGAYPQAGLIQATNGDFYGTTTDGGNSVCPGTLVPLLGGCGTVFKITPSGTLTTLHSFNGADGANPFYAGLVQGTDGNFYGTTYRGGVGNACSIGVPGCGTVFKITPRGMFTILHSFCVQSGCTDGVGPIAGLIQATDGNFYNDDDGSVFKITSSGSFTTLYTSTDLETSEAPLVQATNGDFYGTTLDEGAYCSGNCGTVFSLSVVGLGPFVEPQTTSGKVGSAVKILGTNLTGATSVTFNGTAATFKVASSSLITTTVPTGATTGTVEVLTPAGPLSSNVPFRVP